MHAGRDLHHRHRGAPLNPIYRETLFTAENAKNAETTDGLISWVNPENSSFFAFSAVKIFFYFFINSLKARTSAAIAALRVGSRSGANCDE